MNQNAGETSQEGIPVARSSRTFGTFNPYDAHTCKRRIVKAVLQPKSPLHVMKGDRCDHLFVTLQNFLRIPEMRPLKGRGFTVWAELVCLIATDITSFAPPTVIVSYTLALIGRAGIGYLLRFPIIIMIPLGSDIGSKQKMVIVLCVVRLFLKGLCPFKND